MCAAGWKKQVHVNCLVDYKCYNYSTLCTWDFKWQQQLYKQCNSTVCMNNCKTRPEAKGVQSFFLAYFVPIGKDHRKHVNAPL